MNALALRSRDRRSAPGGLLAALALGLATSGCADDPEARAATGTGECPLGSWDEGAGCAPLPGALTAHTFAPVSLGPGEEQPLLCQSWTLNNQEELWVNAVEMANGGAYHHSNWLFVPDNLFYGEDGAWNCDERDYQEITAAVFGGVLYAQGTQATRGVQRFPEGVAVRLPPHTRIIGGTHLLNTGAREVSTDFTLRLYSVPAGDVTVPLDFFRLNYGALELPPRSRSAFAASCDFEAAAGQPLAGDLYFAMPHYHYLGQAFRLWLVGGERDGELVFEDQGENDGVPFQGLPLGGARGFRFECEYDNPRSTTVGFGVGDQEMCVMLGFTSAGAIFDASVSAGAAAGTVDGVERFEGECSTLGLPR